MVDHFYSDTTRFRFRKPPGRVAMKRGPRLPVDPGFERRLQRTVWIVRAEEIRVADEEALFIVVRVDKPAGDAIGAIAADFAARRIEDIDAENPHLNVVLLRRKDLDVRLAK